jgi:hypothetical protein
MARLNKIEYFGLLKVYSDQVKELNEILERKNAISQDIREARETKEEWKNVRNDVKSKFDGKEIGDIITNSKVILNKIKNNKKFEAQILSLTKPSNHLKTIELIDAVLESKDLGDLIQKQRIEKTGKDGNKKYVSQYVYNVKSSKEKTETTGTKCNRNDSRKFSRDFKFRSSYSTSEKSSEKMETRAKTRACFRGIITS